MGAITEFNANTNEYIDYYDGPSLTYETNDGTVSINPTQHGFTVTRRSIHHLSKELLEGAMRVPEVIFIGEYSTEDGSPPYIRGDRKYVPVNRMEIQD